MRRPEVERLLNIKREERVNSRISYVLNERAAKQLGFSNPAEALGQVIVTGVGDLPGEVVGIIADYHLKSLHQEIQPAIMLSWPSFYFDAGLKVSTSDIAGSLQHIQKVYDNLFPDQIYDYQFLDDSIASFYERLGLLGMISFVVAQRTKEIGVRKVLGAKVSVIVGLFSKDFMKLVGIAFLISSPISWYLMNLWLQDFAYSISIQIWVFAMALVISAIITFTTISIQSVKAAIANPVDALRDE